MLKEGKLIPLLKLLFIGPNSRPISVLPALSKVMERIIHVQIQDFFKKKQLDYHILTCIQKGLLNMYSTYTNVWLREINDSKIAGSVMLDFSALLLID